VIWDPAAETQPRERLGALQLERLRTTIGRILAREIPQAARLREAGLTAAEEVGSLADLARLPFSEKADLREHYPYGLLAVPPEQLLRVHASSGTRGKPTVVSYTRADLDLWSELMARSLASAGVRPGMVLQNAYGYGLFTGGLGFHQGAERLGCLVVPVSGGFTQRQVLLLADLGAQALACTPSYALNIAQAVREAGLGPGELRLELGLFGAEPWSETLRDQLDRELGIRSVNFYGLSEMIGPGVAAECLEARQGSHIQEDHFLAEIVDPASGQPLPAGETGELVLTALTREALPLIRYRTGDICALDAQPCVCGRSFRRMGRVLGRRDDMLIIRGVNVYPSEVERVLLGVTGVAPHYQLVIERPGALDVLTVHCEPELADLDRGELAQRVQRVLHEEIRLSVSVEVQEIGAVPRSEGKAVRVLDRRTR
jgi:phenylacetate-CoA ligase